MTGRPAAAENAEAGIKWRGRGGSSCAPLDMTAAMAATSACLSQIGSSLKAPLNHTCGQVMESWRRATASAGAQGSCRASGRGGSAHVHTGHSSHCALSRANKGVAFLNEHPVAAEPKHCKRRVDRGGGRLSSCRSELRLQTPPPVGLSARGACLRRYWEPCPEPSSDPAKGLRPLGG